MARGVQPALAGQTAHPSHRGHLRAYDLKMFLIFKPPAYYLLPQSALFPDNTYVEDSGGDPIAIPDLTFEEFQVGACCAYWCCFQGTAC